jgi:hypothetical protein
MGRAKNDGHGMDKIKHLIVEHGMSELTGTWKTTGDSR